VRHDDGTLVGTRFQAALLEAIYCRRKDQTDLPTRGWSSWKLWREFPNRSSTRHIKLNSDS